MAEEFTSSLQTLNLSASQITQMTNWPEMMTNDYLTNLRNFLDIAQKADVLVDRVTINEENIELNTQDIEDLQQELSDHINSDSQHGVTGDNVGNEDFAAQAIGGVVLLAGLLSDLTEIVTADIAAAPGAYDQVYTDLVTSLTNENKDKINEIVLKINNLISGQITAKQMAAI